MRTLRLITGDQLSRGISSLRDCDRDHDVVLMCEVSAEATHVKHHKKKIAFLFSAMRHFAAELRNSGCQVDYVELDDEGNTGSFKGEVARALKRHDADRVVVTWPGEYRLLSDMRTWGSELGVDVDILADDRFLCSEDDFAEWANGRKQLRMEFFYRLMRKTHDVLMDGDAPEGGQWNFDSDNRKPPRAGLSVPQPYRARTDDITRRVMELVGDHFDGHFGELEPFDLAVTRDQALYALDKFIDERLPRFGDYQDAMIEDQPWMFHSHLGFYINCGLLDPLEPVRRAERAYRDGHVPLNAAEGFIRQIIGWREYVHGIYWLKMPEYADLNYLEASRPLPALYWGAPTRMNCLRQCVEATRRNAYAHHIQRLMVLGNFALLIGADPKQVNEWYLVVYADAFEWVEMPNVTGMVLFADGGLLASKPYAAGGNYINRMSNYCANCHYQVSRKHGERACPFNYLYWDFLLRNRDRLRNNPRLKLAYRGLSNMSADQVDSIRRQAQRFLEAIDAGEEV